jgi:hypothetical protein
MTIGEKIKDFGINKFGSVKAFAEALGWHPSSLYTYFDDRSMPGAPLLIKLGEWGMDLNWLLLDRTDIVKDPTIPYEASELKKIKEENKELKKRLEQISNLTMRKSKSG